MNKENFWLDLKSGKFASMVKEASRGRSVSNSREVYHIMKPVFAETSDVETIHCIFLDAKNHILAIEKMFSGTITTAAVYSRELIKRLIANRASGFIMIHNHPSGITQPSIEDQTITIKIGIAAASIDVSLHDHIIVGDGYHSMADSGWMKKVSERFKNLIAPQ